MGKEPQKQITLHFAGEHVKILEWMRKEAKERFRSTEQHIVYCLDRFIKNIERGNAIMENLERKIAKISEAPAQSTDEPPAVHAADPVNPEAKEVE